MAPLGVLVDVSCLPDRFDPTTNEMYEETPLVELACAFWGSVLGSSSGSKKDGESMRVLVFFLGGSFGCGSKA